MSLSNICASNYVVSHTYPIICWVVAQVLWIVELDPSYFPRATFFFLADGNAKWRSVLWHFLQLCTQDPQLIPLSAQENAWNSRHITCLKK